MRTPLSKVYSEQLGTEVSNALRKLARKMLHAFAEELGRATCCRCHKKIEHFSEMSLDHQENWINQPNARELFWDLKNVRLAHTACNVKEAGRRKRIDPQEKLRRDRERKRRWEQNRRQAP